MKHTTKLNMLNASSKSVSPSVSETSSVSSSIRSSASLSPSVSFTASASKTLSITDSAMPTRSVTPSLSKTGISSQSVSSKSDDSILTASSSVTRINNPSPTSTNTPLSVIETSSLATLNSSSPSIIATESSSVKETISRTPVASDLTQNSVTVTSTASSLEVSINPTSAPSLTSSATGTVRQSETATSTSTPAETPTSISSPVPLPFVILSNATLSDSDDIGIELFDDSDKTINLSDIDNPELQNTIGNTRISSDTSSSARLEPWFSPKAIMNSLSSLWRNFNTEEEKEFLNLDAKKLFDLQNKAIEMKENSGHISSDWYRFFLDDFIGDISTELENAEAITPKLYKEYKKSLSCMYKDFSIKYDDITPQNNFVGQSFVEELDCNGLNSATLTNSYTIEIGGSTDYLFISQ
ncbi:MAG: hypothetical protein DGJ47_001068 [Rickettsiaceae bacterium]